MKCTTKTSKSHLQSLWVHDLNNHPAVYVNYKRVTFLSHCCSAPAWITEANHSVTLKLPSHIIQYHIYTQNFTSSVLCPVIITVPRFHSSFPAPTLGFRGSFERDSASSSSFSGSGTRFWPAAQWGSVDGRSLAGGLGWGTCWRGTPSPAPASETWCTDSASYARRSPRARTACPRSSVYRRLRKGRKWKRQRKWGKLFSFRLVHMDLFCNL